MRSGSSFIDVSGCRRYGRDAVWMGSGFISKESRLLLGSCVVIYTKES